MYIPAWVLYPDSVSIRSTWVKDKRGKIRFVPAHAHAQRLIESYLMMAGHGDDKDGPLFWPVRNNRTGELERPLNANSLYRNVVRKY